jgi:Domain of unknown function (DUF4157)
VSPTFHRWRAPGLRAVSALRFGGYCKCHRNSTIGEALVGIVAKEITISKYSDKEPNITPTAQSADAKAQAKNLQSTGVLSRQDIREATYVYNLIRGRTGDESAAEKAFVRKIEEIARLRSGGKPVLSGASEGELTTMGGRTLAPGEENLAMRVLPKGVDISKVVVVQGSGGSAIAAIAFKNGNPAITIGNTIYIKNGYSSDLSKSADGIELFSHELNHVRQYQRYGTTGVFARISYQAGKYGSDQAYAYYKRDVSFYNQPLESQSQIVGDYARYRETGTLPSYRFGDEIVQISKSKLSEYAKGSGVYGQ